MSVLVGKETRLLVQGITGKQGRYHTQRMLDCGMAIPAGVSPGKGGSEAEGVPVFDSAAEALQKHPEINASMIITPPKAVLSSALEAIACEIPLLVIITEFVPVLDTLRFVRAARERGVTIVGPNTIGVISPGKGKIGVMPEYIYKPGKIGVVSKSGTLTHEISSNLSFAGFGQSTCLCIGGDPIRGLSHTEGLALLRDDPDTLAVILIGEIGGLSEEDAAQYIAETKYPKPVFAYIAGAQAPEGKKMGHAGAIVSGGMGTARSKIERLRAAGVTVCPTVGCVLEEIRDLNGRMGGALATVEPLRDEAVLR
jgi:succinyl-CoA synthetase alpha subunit